MGTLPLMYPLREYGTDSCFITQISYSLGKIISLTKTEEEMSTDYSTGATVNRQPTTNDPTTVEDTNVDAVRSLELKWLQWHNDAVQVLEAAMSGDRF